MGGLKAFHARRVLERMEVQKRLGLSDNEMKQVDAIVREAPGVLAYKAAAAKWMQSHGR